MTAPTFAPHERPREEVATASSYRRSDPVWVYRAGDWRPGVVETSSEQAVLVTLRPSTGGGTAVDTMTATYIVDREDEDTSLDQAPRLDTRLVPGMPADKPR